MLRHNSAQAAWSLLTKRASNRRIRGAAAAARNLLRQRAYPALCEGLACIGHPLLVARAKDVTVQTAARSCLVLAPHPDDETLGCGATIMRKLAAGTRVEIIIATDGRHSVNSDKVSAAALAEIREEEARCAAAVLGLPSENIVFLRFEDGRLTGNRQTLRDRLFAIFEQINPDEILVHQSSILTPIIGCWLNSGVSWYSRATVISRPFTNTRSGFGIRGDGASASWLDFAYASCEPRNF